MSLTYKQRAFIDEYLRDFNATQAAIRAGYSPKSATIIGHENLRKPNIKSKIAELLETRVMSREEALARLSNIASFDVSDYITTDDDGRPMLDLAKLKRDGLGHMVRSIKHTRDATTVEWASPDDALKQLLDAMRPTGSESDPLHTKVLIDRIVELR